MIGREVQATAFSISPRAFFCIAIHRLEQELIGHSFVIGHSDGPELMPMLLEVKSQLRLIQERHRRYIIALGAIFTPSGTDYKISSVSDPPAKRVANIGGEQQTNFW
jgi:hypothetical protein